MLYITGDTHGNQDRWNAQIDPMLRAGDVIFVAGDFGIGFWGTAERSEDAFFDAIGQRPYTVCFVDGNHENFRRLEAYPRVPWQGGSVHRIRENVLHLIRGELYNIGGMTLFAFGGGYSLDRYRRRENVSWWPEEMPNEAEYRHAEETLQRAEERVDCVLTHTAPSESVYYLSTLRRLEIHGDCLDELPLTAFLDTVQRRLTYRCWYCGHFHADVEMWRRQTVVYNTVRELESGRIVKQWESYEE